MSYEIVYNSQDYVQLLVHIAKDLKTEYIRHYPYNLGYRHSNGYYSWDCFNLIKSIIWGWKEGGIAGSYTRPDPSTGLGDWAGAKILSCCSDISNNFGSVSPGAYILFSDNDHAGTFIGDIKIDSRLVNVVECTAAWGGGVKFSYVDNEGKRYNYKGGTQNGRWLKHGKLPWIDYGEVSVPMKTFYAYKSGIAVKDPQVLRLQILLNGLAGAGLSKDSYYGPATTRAVAKWQRDHDIKETGNCDEQTWKSILSY